MENERLRDLEERDAFAGRLKNKDKDKTRHIMSKTEKKVCLRGLHPNSSFSSEVCLTTS